MKPRIERMATRAKSNGRFGLLSNGSSGAWSIEVDEALDRDEWWMEIDSPSVYLVFQLDDLAKPGEALRFLQCGRRSRPARKSEVQKACNDTLNLGRFGSAPVSLLKDN